MIQKLFAVRVNHTIVRPSAILLEAGHSKDNGFVKLPPHRPFDRKMELKPGEERIPLLLLEIYDRDPRISRLGLHKDLYDRGLC